MRWRGLRRGIALAYGPGLCGLPRLSITTNITPSQGRDEELLDIGGEEQAVDGTVEDAWRFDPIGHARRQGRSIVRQWPCGTDATRR